MSGAGLRFGIEARVPLARGQVRFGTSRQRVIPWSRVGGAAEAKRKLTYNVCSHQLVQFLKLYVPLLLHASS
jgi:hypothetical protein